jgi:hypothetical protein
MAVSCCRRKPASQDKTVLGKFSHYTSHSRLRGTNRTLVTPQYMLVRDVQTHLKIGFQTETRGLSPILVLHPAEEISGLT